MVYGGAVFLLQGTVSLEGIQEGFPPSAHEASGQGLSDS